MYDIEVSGLGFRGFGFWVLGLGFRVWGASEESLPTPSQPSRPSASCLGMRKMLGVPIEVIGP